MFSPFQELLKKAINHHGMGGVVEASQICTKFNEVKGALFPEDEENVLKPKHFKDHTLTIQVPDSVWANEVINRQSKIISEVNSKYGQKVIEKIKTELEEMKKDEMA